MPPNVYDPSSENEQAPPLPSAPLRTWASNIVLQPPLTRRGSGPGVILLLPDNSALKLRTGSRPLDPEPVKKWAEEGFTVAGVACSDLEQEAVSSALGEAINGLLALDELDTRDRLAVIAYDISPELLSTLGRLEGLPITCFVLFGISLGANLVFPTAPTLLHSTKGVGPAANVTVHSYTTQSNHFVLPQSLDYDPGNAALAHSRSLVFLRKWLGGPIFDLEAIWDEHCYFEFEVRSVAKTMATMVQEPYVNHVPTMTGGVGRAALTAFYRDHFIFSNPDDAQLQIVSRTVGADRIVDEFIYKATHSRIVDWLLPGVPPTGRKISIPMMAVVSVRGDRLYNEHIWWDQGTTLQQVGILPSHLPYSESTGTIRLPVAGPECADMLLDEGSGKSNEMMGDDWGVQR